MSSSLLRKSLELVECDYLSNYSESSNTTQVKIIRNSKKIKDQRGTADVQRRNIRSVEQARKQLKKKREKALSNLEKLDKLRRPVIDENIAKLILENTRKPGDRDDELIFLKEEPKTVFTEEDFARFETEYIDDD